jgi:hypothetical protein
MNEDKTIFEAIKHQRKAPCGDFMEVFEPIESEDFIATDAEPGSAAKIDVLCRRLEQGFPLWHKDDPVFDHCVSGDSRLHTSGSGHLDSRYVLGVIRKGLE